MAEQLKDSPDTASIPIILMTRFGDTELMQQALQMGIGVCIPKDPFSDAVLIETLRRMGLIAPSAQ